MRGDDFTDKSPSKDVVSTPSAAKVDRKVRHCLADIVEHVARNTRPMPADVPVIELDVKLPRDEEHGLGLQITPGELGQGRSSVEIISVTPEIARQSPQHALVRGGDFIVAVAGERGNPAFAPLILLSYGPRQIFTLA